jgi:DNA primase
MMIQVFSEYSNLVKAGRAKALLCPQHEDQVFPLYHTYHSDDSISLDCFACGYKREVGLFLYNTIKNIVAEMSEPEKVEQEDK